MELCNWYMQEHNTGSIWKSSASKKKGGRTWMFSLVIREAWEELQKKQTKESKEFMKPVITPSGEDYLETILVLQKKLGMVRSVDVARHMEVSKPSVCHAVATLRDGGFLTMDEDHFLHLTDVGREVAEKSTSDTASLPSSLSPQALTPGLRRLTPAGLNTSLAMRAFHD